MKYTIDIGREIGENTFDFIFVNTFDDEQKWNEAIESISKGFKDADCEVEVSINKNDADFTKAYVTYKRKK